MEKGDESTRPLLSDPRDGVEQVDTTAYHTALATEHTRNESELAIPPAQIYLTAFLTCPRWAQDLDLNQRSWRDPDKARMVTAQDRAVERARTAGRLLEDVLGKNHLVGPDSALVSSHSSTIDLKTPRWRWAIMWRFAGYKRDQVAALIPLRNRVEDILRMHRCLPLLSPA